MSLRTAEELFSTLEAIGLDHLRQNAVGTGTVFFKGVLFGGRGVCGVYIHNTSCCVYIQRKQFDPLFPKSIPDVTLVQTSLCCLFDADSESDAPNFEDVRRTLGSEYYSMFWGSI